MNQEVMIKHCEKCKELTPQIDNNTTGMCCQVCMHSNPYGVESAAAKATSEWLATFWQQKYFAVAGFIAGNASVVVCEVKDVPRCPNCWHPYDDDVTCAECIDKKIELDRGTIEAYKHWDKIADYESDATTVTLINAHGVKVATFNYPRFTKDDFDKFRSTCR